MASSSTPHHSSSSSTRRQLAEAREDVKRFSEQAARLSSTVASAPTGAVGAGELTAALATASLAQQVASVSLQSLPAPGADVGPTERGEIVRDGDAERPAPPPRARQGGPAPPTIRGPAPPPRRPTVPSVVAERSVASSASGVATSSPSRAAAVAASSSVRPVGGTSYVRRAAPVSPPPYEVPSEEYRTCRIRVRLLDGTLCESLRTFAPDEPVEQILLEAMPHLRGRHAPAASKAGAGLLLKTLKLVVPFPHACFDTLTLMQTTTVAQAGLAPNGTCAISKKA